MAECEVTVPIETYIKVKVEAADEYDARRLAFREAKTRTAKKHYFGHWPMMERVGNAPCVQIWD